MRRAIASYGIAAALITVAMLFASPNAAAVGSQQPSPAPSTSPETSPGAQSSAPPGVLLINGEVIDLERGFIVFSSGDAFRLSASVSIVDDATGGAPQFRLDPGYYAIASMDATSGLIDQVRVSPRPLTAGTPAAQIPHHYAVEASPFKVNPDLKPRPSVYGNQLSKSTTVTLEVEVPANTPFTDDVFVTTDTSGWNPQAIRMQRLDGLHFRIQVDLAGGTDFHYLFTRGSWKTVERDEAGLERKARELFVPGGVADVIRAKVYRWADIP